jgi:hypothetical protein
MGRPRGTGTPAEALAGRNGNVRILLHLPVVHAAALRARAELPLTGHLRVALARLLEQPRARRPALPEVDAIGSGPGRQVWLPRAMVGEIERAYGVARREAAILAAVAAYLGAR